MTVLLVLGLLAATWRATRLLVVDEFPPVKAIREGFIRVFAVVDESGMVRAGRGPHWGEKTAEATLGTHVVRAAAGVLRGLAHAIAYVWTCQWCMSVYAGAALVTLADWRLSVPYPWLVVASGSALAGAMSWIETEHDQRWEIRQREVERGR